MSLFVISFFFIFKVLNFQTQNYVMYFGYYRSRSRSPHYRRSSGSHRRRSPGSRSPSPRGKNINIVRFKLLIIECLFKIIVVKNDKNHRNVKNINVVVIRQQDLIIVNIVHQNEIMSKQTFFLFNQPKICFLSVNNHHIVQIMNANDQQHLMEKIIRLIMMIFILSKLFTFNSFYFFCSIIIL